MSLLQSIPPQYAEDWVASLVTGQTHPISVRGHKKKVTMFPPIGSYSLFAAEKTTADVFWPPTMQLKHVLQFRHKNSSFWCICKQLASTMLAQFVHSNICITAAHNLKISPVLLWYFQALSIVKSFSTTCLLFHMCRSVVFVLSWAVCVTSSESGGYMAWVQISVERCWNAGCQGSGPTSGLQLSGLMWLSYDWRRPGGAQGPYSRGTVSKHNTHIVGLWVTLQQSASHLDLPCKCLRMTKIWCPVSEKVQAMWARLHNVARNYCWNINAKSMKSSVKIYTCFIVFILQSS